MKDYFNILGVDPGATEDQIRTAYKKLAMQHHPDRGGDQTRFQEIQEAYSTLTDSQKRAEWENQKQFGDQGNFGFSFNFGGHDFNDILRQFHGHHPFGNFRQVPKNRDLRVAIDLDLASTLDSQTQYVEVGNADGSKRTVQVNVPKGVQSGMQMRFPGHGENRIPNVAPGDLYVEFRVRKAPGFEVDNLNLHKKTTLNCIDAMLGTSITVMGLDNRVFDLTIPSGTQPNTQFRIPQQGLWDINHPRRGDLFIEILIEIPRQITEDQFEKLKRLR